MPRKSKGKRNKIDQKNSDIIEADLTTGQQYGKIVKSLGNCHFSVTTVKNSDAIASISNRLKNKKIRIYTGDWVLIEPFDTNKYKIIFKYTTYHVKYLTDAGFLDHREDPNIIAEREAELVKEDSSITNNDNDIVFGDDDNSKCINGIDDINIYFDNI